MSNAIIFNGDYLKALKPKLKLSEAAYIETGSADPTTLSLTSPIGSLYLRSNGVLYVKYGAGASAWAPSLLTGTGSALTNTALTDDSVYFVDNLDNSKRLYFQLSSIASGQSRTLTIPDTSGSIVLGSYNAGQVTYWAPGGTTQLYDNPSTLWSGFGLNPNGAQAYSFFPSSSATISKIDVKLNAFAGATGNVRAALWSTSAGVPQTLLETSPTIIDASTHPINTPGSFIFSSTALVSGTEYAVVIYGVSISGTVAVYETSGTNKRSVATNYSSPTWNTVSSVNGVFTVYGTINSAPVLLSESQLSPTRGGTGVNNTGTLTYGSNNITLSTTGTTSITLPTSGTLATLAGVENLTNKTINSSSIGSTSASSGAFTLLTVKGTGAAGTSYLDLLNESAAPTAPAFGYSRVYTTTNFFNIKNASNYIFAFDYSALTQSRTLSAPDRSSVIATLDGDQIFTGKLSISASNVVGLSVTGGVKIGNVTASAPTAGSGAIRYSSGFLYYSDGTNWTTVATYANSVYQNTSFIASANTDYFVDTTSATVTATLPSGSVNAKIKFTDIKEKWGLNPLTIVPATGEKIDNLAVNESLVMDINGSWIELAWDTTTLSWVITGSLAYGTTPVGFVTHTGNSLGTDLLIGTSDNYKLQFETNNIIRATIDTNGNVGIGTSSPQALLDINGGFKGVYNSYAINTLLTKNNHFVIATAAITLTLPTLTANDAGFTLYIKRVTAAGIVTIDPGAGVTIDGSSTWPLTSNYESVKLVWRGASDWSIF